MWEMSFAQKVFIFDSPDGTGKTEIGKEMAKRAGIPYFKMTTEHENWRKGTFKEALRFDQTYIVEFLKQTRFSVVIDRAYPAEWVYSKVYKRKTDEEVLRKVDTEFAKLKATIIIPLRRDYTNSRPDEVVEKKYLPKLHDMYLEFVKWSKCDCIPLYVDDLQNDLNKEIAAIYRGLTELGK